MSNKDEAMKLALEALDTTESECGGHAWEREQEAIDALREALAEQTAQQEPVTSAAKGAIMAAAYDFRDAHISGSTNLKRSAHAALEAAVDAAIAPQPAQQGLTDFPSLLNEAEEIVRGKPVWKRFIDGTPLSNDIAVWMTVFAQDVARRTSPQPEQEPLTDEQAKSTALDVMGFAVLDKEQAKTAMMLIRGTEAAHGIKENT